jgi:hypothetical protein
MDAQKVISDNALSMPAVDNPFFFALTSKVKGFRVNPIGWGFYIGDMYVQT